MADEGQNPDDKPDDQGGDSASDEGGDNKPNNNKQGDKSENDKGQGHRGSDNQQDDKPKPKWPWIVGGVVVAAFVVIVLLITFCRTRMCAPTTLTSLAFTRWWRHASAARSPPCWWTNQPVRAGQLLAVMATSRPRSTKPSDGARVLQAQVARRCAALRQPGRDGRGLVSATPVSRYRVAPGPCLAVAGRRQS